MSDSAGFVVPPRKPNRYGIEPRDVFPEPGRARGLLRRLFELFGYRDNAPALDAYPSSDDGLLAAATAYGTGNEGFMSGNGPLFTAPRYGDAPEKEAARDVLRRAQMAIIRNPVAALGFDPRRVGFVDVPTEATNVAGLFDVLNDVMVSNVNYPSNVVHESIHRGIMKLRDAGLFPKELKDIDDEYITRWLMIKLAGDPERGRGEAADKQIKTAESYFRYWPEEHVTHGLNKLLDAAAQMIARQRPGGPR